MGTPGGRIGGGGRRSCRTSSPFIAQEALRIVVNGTVAPPAPGKARVVLGRRGPKSQRRAKTWVPGPETATGPSRCRCGRSGDRTRCAAAWSGHAVQKIEHPQVIGDEIVLSPLVHLSAGERRQGWSRSAVPPQLVDAGVQVFKVALIELRPRKEDSRRDNAVFAQDFGRALVLVAVVLLA